MIDINRRLNTKVTIFELADRSIENNQIKAHRFKNKKWKIQKRINMRHMKYCTINDPQREERMAEAIFEQIMT